MLSNYYWNRYLWVGIPAEMLIRNADVIRRFIERNSLAPLEDTEIGKAIGSPVMRRASGRRGGAPGVGAAGLEARFDVLEESVIRPPDFPGGMRLNHLHFEGRRYLLTRQQWSDFSGEMLRTYSDRLAQVQHVSFDELASISAAVDSLSTKEG